MNLIYTQSGMIYEKIQDVLRPSNTSPCTPGKESHAVDGIIGSASLQAARKPSGATLTASSRNSSSNPPTDFSSKINSISSDKGKS